MGYARMKVCAELVNELFSPISADVGVNCQKIIELLQLPQGTKATHGLLLVRDQTYLIEIWHPAIPDNQTNDPLPWVIPKYITVKAPGSNESIIDFIDWEFQKAHV